MKFPMRVITYEGLALPNYPRLLLSWGRFHYKFFFYPDTLNNVIIIKIIKHLLLHLISFLDILILQVAETHGLNHWGHVTHICISKLTITGSDNGLSPGQSDDIIWTNAGILLIGPPRTIVNEIFKIIKTFSFKKMHIKCRQWNGIHFVSASMC